MMKTIKKVGSQTLDFIYPFKCPSEHLKEHDSSVKETIEKEGVLDIIYKEFSNPVKKFYYRDEGKTIKINKNGQSQEIKD